MQFFRPVNKVEAMTFDLDDTLYNNEPIIREAEKALQAHIAKRHPVAAKLSANYWFALKKQAIAKDNRLASDMGQLRRVVLTAALSGTAPDALSITPSEDPLINKAVDECFNCFYDARSNFAIEESILKTLKKVSAHIPLIAITNGNVDTKKIGIDGFFQASLHASLKRPMKPAPDMFNEAANLLGIAPKHILHVGDNIIKDVYGALNAGYQTAWFACNRPMNLNSEPARLLPHVQLDSLSELTLFIN